MKKIYKHMISMSQIMKEYLISGNIKSARASTYLLSFPILSLPRAQQLINVQSWVMKKHLLTK